VLVVFLVGLNWASVAFPVSVEQLWPQSPESRPSRFVEYEGWPIICGMDSRRYDYPALVVNVLVGAVCLVSVAIVVERIQRSSLALRLSTIFTGIVALALLFAYWRYDLQLASRYLSRGGRWEPIWGRYYPLTLSLWTQSAPVLLSLACVAFLLLSTTLRRLSWAIARLRRPAPAKVEADGSPAR
jgi:hypothetical protein